MSEPPARSSATKAQKQARLGKALRANLQRRKAQARAKASERDAANRASAPGEKPGQPR